ncbi:hypothetical protein LPJ70_003323 [Coemansia sp. RSA 2708]|nr:hypothetical protein LPJ70_003323 [Coemansia sp. RSA 2708]KAJ2310542.1 hypothetical protein IWW54_003134 [Coemansia sp. RSA 2705]
MPPPPAPPPPPGPTPEQKLQVKRSMLEQFQGGVIAVVYISSHAKVAERVGARGLIVSNLKRFEADNKMHISAAAPSTVREVLSTTVLPTFGRIRLGHTIEAKLMQACGVNGIDEHEGLANTTNTMIARDEFAIPFISGVTDVASAIKAIAAGATGLRTNCGTTEDMPNIQNTSKNLRTIISGCKELIAKLATINESEYATHADTKAHDAKVLKDMKKCKRLPVPLFADGGIVLPMDVAMMLSMGADAVIVSAQVFQAADPDRRLRSLVMAAKYFRDPVKLATISEDTSGPSGVAFMNNQFTGYA